jgi:Flp pilus assembly protein TadG
VNNAINNARRNRRKRLGQTLVEFTFVGIPIIFILISIFEVSRGMWIYHTLAYTAKVGARYASVHGINCVGKTVNALLDNPNDCAVKMGPADTAGTIAYVMRQASVGLDPVKTTVVFNASGASTTCSLDVSGGSNPCPATIWPPYDATGVNTFNYVGEPIRIDITTPFSSALAMLWPGAKVVKFASGTLGATSQEYVQF